MVLRTSRVPPHPVPHKIRRAPREGTASPSPRHPARTSGLHAAGVLIVHTFRLPTLSDDPVLALIALVGILSMLLVVATSVLYLVLPLGRMCPRCGGYTNQVLLRKLLRLASRWLQWRWCSRCGWEGPGRRGPDLGPLDPPVDHESGFRWSCPNLEDAPVFHWHDPDENADADLPPVDHPSGFQWGASPPAGPDPARARTRNQRTGFYFGPAQKAGGSTFEWGPGKLSARGGERTSVDDSTRRPWYLSWLVSRDAMGFQWKSDRD